jgi:hypothetical protein
MIVASDAGEFAEELSEMHSESVKRVYPHIFANMNDCEYKDAMSISTFIARTPENNANDVVWSVMPGDGFPSGIVMHSTCMLAMSCWK